MFSTLNSLFQCENILLTGREFQICFSRCPYLITRKFPRLYWALSHIPWLSYTPQIRYHIFSWAPFQYPIRRIIVRSRKVSKSRDLFGAAPCNPGEQLSNRSEVHSFVWNRLMANYLANVVSFSPWYRHLESRAFCLLHDDVIKWKHFPRNWPFVRGIHRSRWIPHTKASDAELWCFLWSASE